MKKELLILSAAAAVFAITGCASLQDQAEKGDPAAQWQLADCMMNGTEGYSKNPGQAKQWLEKSIASENPEAVALKAEFTAYGRYGANPDVEAALKVMEPVVLNGNDRRISYGFLKVVFANSNYNHFNACAKAIENAYGYESDDFTDAENQHRWELALMFQKQLNSFMQGAYKNFDSMRLDEQKEYMKGISNFLANGCRYNHEWNDREREYHRADERAFQPQVAKAQGIIERLRRTIEVEGEGANAKACENDAKRKAVEQLCGVKITSSSSLKQSEDVNNSAVNEQSNFKQDISSQMNDNLESFSIVIPAKIQADGTYKGMYRATAKPGKAIKKNAE